MKFLPGDLVKVLFYGGVELMLVLEAGMTLVTAFSPSVGIVMIYPAEVICRETPAVQS